jgi:hypothetical protein
MNGTRHEHEVARVVRDERNRLIEGRLAELRRQREAEAQFQERVQRVTLRRFLDVPASMTDFGVLK